jgi:hypothetical protein
VVLELGEIQLLLNKFGVRERTLALLDAGTGPRVSELLRRRPRTSVSSVPFAAAQAGGQPSLAAIRAACADDAQKAVRGSATGRRPNCSLPQGA